MEKIRQAGNYDRNKAKEKEGTKKGKEAQKFHTTDIIQPIGGKEDQIIQNDLEYADDTQVLIERYTHEQLCERIGNYDAETEKENSKHYGQK